MHTFILAVVALVLGYLIYGKLVDTVFHPDDRPTPAVASCDNMDYVPMPKWKAFIIQLLNIAGTGPIFGAVMGAMWGPAVFVWIVFGSILGGAVHDYMSGMMSIRNNGASVTELIGKYLGKYIKLIFLPFSILVLILVAAVFTRSAADLFTIIFGIDVWVWIVIIMAYFFISCVLPIDQIIGRIYPVFGIILTVMVILLLFGTVACGYSIPDLTFENQHPEGLPMWPFMFITVACGAISGFHSTQSPMVARCMTDERQGRWIFYGAMIAEGFIALCCAAAALAFYGNGGGIYAAVQSSGVSTTIYNISLSTIGIVGAMLTTIGIAICPITSGDTALRSVRLIIMDIMKVKSTDKKAIPLITTAIVIIVFCLLFIDFNILWRYFSWSNQVMATVVLWAATVYLVLNCKKVYYSVITFLPALFMSAVTVTYIFTASEGFGVDYTISVYVGIVAAVILGMIFLLLVKWNRFSDFEAESRIDR